MEDMKKEHPEGCKCMMCGDSGMKCGGMCGGKHWGCCGGGRHMILRLILGIIILLAVFCGGFKLGVIVGSINGGGFYGSHMQKGYIMQRGYYPTGMMGGWYYPTATSTR